MVVELSDKIVVCVFEDVPSSVTGTEVVISEVVAVVVELSDTVVVCECGDVSSSVVATGDAVFTVVVSEVVISIESVKVSEEVSGIVFVGGFDEVGSCVVDVVAFTESVLVCGFTEVGS